ncbi:AtpZ/AtpI family protein [Algoriphagus hitonicola]|uniref:Putative F0F1-ATPase subunit Ca2+/Mg2+ transporter n=1 Tax=Algoriphagus hitonicola TaxID=435880 RepID=A0A1I2VZA8_9BACT|nr:AtpZ/AtpI family protein [Algoriphagus hitonicola]SFG94372.1 Putative F0F1-ATPase subunit Ca2+/Mg2+ transporter [Algoriphagus hitonicola]
MNKKEPQKPRFDPPLYMKYIGLSFQLFAVIGGGTWLGWWIQGKSEMKFPIWIMLFVFLSIALAFYQLWQSLQKDERSK